MKGRLPTNLPGAAEPQPKGNSDEATEGSSRTNKKSLRGAKILDDCSMDEKGAEWA
jgi:hypothetical protein